MRLHVATKSGNIIALENLKIEVWTDGIAPVQPYHGGTYVFPNGTADDAVAVDGGYWWCALRGGDRLTLCDPEQPCA